ncbi:MAG TPA: cell envelope biogenesis protein TolA [Allosphingosinicella sp.]|jgi:outer membrane biosynthesis protein TonB
MDRAEAAGLGIATAGHLALLAALSFGFAATRQPAPKTAPIEVSFVDEVGLESTSPTPLADEPAPLAAPQDAPPEPAMPAPPEIQQVPKPQPPASAPAPAPRPAPREAAKPKPSPAPARPTPAPSKSTSRPATLRKPFSVAIPDAAEGSGKSEAAAPAAAASAEVKASLGRLVREQLSRHWDSPSGADAELLRTELSIWLARDGSVTRVEVLRTTGQTPSNRPQVKLHQEQALRAVRLASPFRLPDKFYEAWKHLSPIGFDRRLSR